MTYVNEGAKTIDAGLGKMKDAMIKDYVDWTARCNEHGGEGRELSDINKRMIGEYEDNYTITYGKKYIKITEKGGGVKAFVVGVDNDKKFKMGDILKPAGYAAPARNKARGNILEGNYAINWTGPLYL